MMRRAHLALGAFLLVCLTTDAAGELIPVPSFSNHEVRATDVPRTDSPGWDLVHVGALILALVLSTYFALVTRSRKHLLALSVASVAWFGFVRDGCVCSVGSIQNVAQSLFDARSVVPLSVLAFFTLPLVFTLFFGRTFCAAVCPLGAAQELVAVRSVKVPRWLDHALGLFPFMYLGAAVLFASTGTAYIICQYDPIVPFFRAASNTNMLVFGGCIMLISLFVGRPYCRYLCPYGALLSLLSRVSKWHLAIITDSCTRCQQCERACPYGAISPPAVAQSPEQNVRGKRYLGCLLLASPIIVACTAWLGTTWSVPLSRLDFQVRLAEQVLLEETEHVASTDASDASRNSGRPLHALYAEGVERQQHFVCLGGWLGAWIGFVLSAKLVQLSIRRRRTQYHLDQLGCVACGRCFQSCPVEPVRLGLIQDSSETAQEIPR